jgi:hypothetical protein
MATIIRRAEGGIVKSELDYLCYWINERESIRLKRQKNLPPPWTDDTLLDEYRWCNVRRMDDKVSVWILGWHREHPEFHIRERMVAAVAGRLINWPDTLETLPYPIPYQEKYWSKVLTQRENRGQKVFTGAYIINGALGGPKVLQVTQKILQPLWDNRTTAPKEPKTMEDVWRWLNGQPGIGSFMAGQAVADLRHIHPELPWGDRYTWAPQGPGSKRGINRLLGRPVKNSTPAVEWLDTLRHAMVAVQARLPAIAERMELMDMQNCMCEYDKYRRLSRGEGSVRAKYRRPS